MDDSREGSVGCLREPWRTWVDLTRFCARQKHGSLQDATARGCSDDTIALATESLGNRREALPFAEIHASRFWSRRSLLLSSTTRHSLVSSCGGDRLQQHDSSRGRALGVPSSVPPEKALCHRAILSGRHSPESTNLDSPDRAFEASNRDASASDPVHAADIRISRTWAGDLTCTSPNLQVRTSCHHQIASARIAGDEQSPSLQHGSTACVDDLV